MAQQKKPEMWFMDLAKSRIMLFFSKSCELVLFFGCLWITLTMTDPTAKTWANGIINTVFITIMGFAIDAAFPESWMHVVLQRLEGKDEQFKWSRAIALTMTFLVAANVIYTMFAGDSGNTAASGIPTNAQGWIVDSLIIVRLLVGISYVAIRECQGMIDRRTPLTPPALQSDSWQWVGLAAHLQQEFLQALTKQGGELTEMIRDLSARVEQEKNALRAEDQRLLASMQETKNTPSDLLVQGVCERLKTLFLEQSATTIPQMAPPKSGEEKRQKNAVVREQKQLIKTGVPDVSRRPRKILDTEVDAIVWPIKNSDKSLSHRKIAPLTEYSETVVYASLKRWRESQSSVCVESPETREEAKEESETIG